LKIVLPKDQQKNSFNYRSDLAKKKWEKCKKAHPRQESTVEKIKGNNKQ
jgi:hypothetical protein